MLLTLLSCLHVKRKERPMKRWFVLVLVGVALAGLLASRPASASTAVYTDETDFVTALAGLGFNTYSLRDFDGATTPDPQPDPLVVSDNGFDYTVDTDPAGDLIVLNFGGHGGLAPLRATSEDLVLTMSHGGYYAVGGHVWNSDWNSDFFPGPITGTVSDGTSFAVSSTSADSFLGFISTDPIAWMRIASDHGVSSFATLNHIYVAGMDIAKPSSSVNALTSPTGSTSIPVTWSADDGTGGTGVAAVHLYVSYNGGAYSEAGSGFTGTGTTYTAGSGDGTYSFYTRAEDYAGNLEDAPGAADASVVVDTTKPTSSLDAVVSPQSAFSFPVSWTVGDGTGSGVAKTHLWYRYNGGAWTELGAGFAGAGATFTSPEGSGTYELYTCADDAAGNVEDAPAGPDQTVLVSVPTSLAFTVPPAGARVMVNLPAVQVSVLDEKGNVVPNATNSVYIALESNPTSSPLYGVKARVAVAGVATFSDLRLSRAGKGYTLSAAATGLGAAASAPFDIITGAVERLVFVTQPGNTPVGQGIAPAVQVAAVDGLGNVVTPFADPVQVSLYNNPGKAMLGGTLSVTPVAGIATFSGLTISKAAKGYTLRTAAVRMSGAVSNQFSVTAVP